MAHGDCAEVTSRHMQSKACSLPDKGQTFLLKSGMLTDSSSFFVLFPGGTQGNKHFPDRMDIKRNQTNCCCKNLSEKTPSVRNDWLSDARPHLHCNEKTERIMLTSSILISHERIDLKYKMALHNYLRKAKSAKCFWNCLLLHQQRNITPDVFDIVVLLVKK